VGARITILGAGPGGYTGAIKAARLGADVTVIDQGEVGGVCLHWGCVPTKTMKATAEALETIRAAEEYGITLDGGFSVDMEKVMRRKREVIDTLADGILKSFRKTGVKFIQGVGEVLNPRLVRVTALGGETVDIANDRLILATGSRPVDIPGLRTDGKSVLSSDHALTLTEVPPRLLIVGGGVVGCEFACIFNAMGSTVTVVEAFDRLLPLESVDRDSSKSLQRELKKRKVQCELNRTVTKLDVSTEGTVTASIGPSPFFDPASLKPREKQEVTLEADKVLVCVGRGPNAAGAGLDSAGLEVDRRGWVVADARMRANLPDVYAVGDILGPERVMLAHAASAEAGVAVENALGANRDMDYSATPIAIFTTPEVAGVGLTELQARDRNSRADVEIFQLRELGKAQADGHLAGHVKIVYDTSNGAILGAHIVGRHAAELVNEAGLAIAAGVTMEKLASTIHAHPTFAEAFIETAQAAFPKIVG